jgi:sulfatase maturation enzyme AslB (radical SAM superfamily)
LTTLTKQSLEHPEAIIDEYVQQQFHSIFLRPLSPYGFAIKAQRNIGYSVQEFLTFYKRALAHLLKINQAGYSMDEIYTKLLLQNIFTPHPSGYVDLRSPAGAGLGCLLYNYDGKVYASDEGRMLAEMGDDRFCLGTVQDRYQTLMTSPGMQLVLEGAINDALPGCSDCAFAPYCGADPVFHAGRQGEPIGHRPSSEFCIKHTGLFNILFEKLFRADPDEMAMFMSWLTVNGSEGTNSKAMVS